MNLFNAKSFGLLLASAVTAFCTAPAYAIPSSTADELYSESIYIEKSSAELPGAIASNASGEEQMSASPASLSMEAASDEEAAPVEKAAPVKHKKKKAARK